MSDSDNKNQTKGFKGLQSLGTKNSTPDIGPSETPEDKANSLDLPIARANTAQQSRQVQQSQSKTAAPPWRGWIIGLGILVVIVGFFILVGNQPPSSSSYSTPSVMDYSPPTVAEASTATLSSDSFVTMPPVGSGLVLTSDQIRYCVYEDRRIKGAEKVVNNYNQESVNSFNAMVEDYNSRCGYFKYRSGALSSIESEANQIQAQLEQEGRERMTLAQSGNAAADAAAAATEAVAAATASDSIDAAEVLNGDVEQDADNEGLDYEASPDSNDSTVDLSNEYGKTYETSFDCDKAHSIPEFLICHDPMLAADDRELAQLYQEAKTSVTDPAGLAERARKQWNYREKNCRDKRCLLSWYVYQMDVMRKIAQTGDVNAK